MTEPSLPGERSESSARSRSFSAFAGRVALLLAVTASIAIGLVQGSTEVRRYGAPIVFRSRPRTITTNVNLPEAIDDEQLTRVLTAMRPRFRTGQPKINHVDHALRCWGLPAEFDDGESLSGEEMRRLLVDYNRFVDVYGATTPPLMQSSESGIRVLVQKGEASSSHVDHTLATLAEIGTPIDFPLALKDREATYGELLEGALGRFHLDQQEYEWTALAYYLFAENPERPFQAEDGRVVSMDDLAARLMRQTLDQGVCYGNHRLYTLAVLERGHREAIAAGEPGLFSEGIHDRIVEHLQRATATLVASQTPEGYWEVNGLAPHRELDEELSVEGRRILMTGHALEFWAVASPEIKPHREPVVRAAQWLVRQIDSMPEASIQTNYTFLTHACRALCLWRGEEPHGSWRRLRSDGAS